MRFQIVRKARDSLNFIYEGRHYYLGTHSAGHDWMFMLVSADKSYPTWGQATPLEFIMRERSGKSFIALRARMEKAVESFKESGHGRW